MEITEPKVVAWMLTSSKRPLNFCASSSCREKTIFLIFMLRIWIRIRIRIHNSCLPSEKTIWSKKTTFYGEIIKVKDVSVGMIYNFYFKCLTLTCTIEWSKWPKWLPLEKTILSKKTTFYGGMAKVNVVVLILTNSNIEILRMDWYPPQGSISLFSPPITIGISPWNVVFFDQIVFSYGNHVGHFDHSIVQVRVKHLN